MRTYAYVNTARSKDNDVYGQMKIALIGVLCLVATATQVSADESGHYAKTVRSFMEIREQNVVRQEFDISCGAAALATILTYQHGDPVPERAIAKAMLKVTDSELVRQRLGFSLLDLKRFVDARGYEGDGYGDMTFDDLVDMAPAIVPVRLSVYDHFVVFRGIARGRVILADPAYGNRTLMPEEFLDVWHSRIAFVVRSKDSSPSPNRLGVDEDTALLLAPSTIRAVMP